MINSSIEKLNELMINFQIQTPHKNYKKQNIKLQLHLGDFSNVL